MKVYKKGLLYLSAFFISFVAFCFTMKIWNRDLTVPFVYVEDGLGPLLEIKTLSDGNDVYHYNYFNAPFKENELYGVKGYNLYLMVFRFLLMFTDKIGLVENIFYLLTYPLIAVTMLFVLKRFGIRDEIALIGGILYSFLPYHFLRNEMHLFFSSYIFIPLVSYAIIVLYNDQFEGSNTITFEQMNKSLLYKDNLISICGCFLLGASDIYNSFFAAIIICFAGVISSIRYKKKRNLYFMAILVLALIIPILINVAPALIHNANSDIAYFAGNRNLNDVDRYGIRISQFLMPITGHRLPVLAALREQYDNAGFANLLETNMNSLGLFMSIGLLIGLFALFFCKREKTILIAAAQINLFIILLAGIGGLNIFVAMFVTYYIRAYCRIVVFVAAFSNIIICICLSKLISCRKNKRDNNKVKFPIRYIISILVIILGVLDQTSASYATGTDFDYVSNWYGTLDELEIKWNNDKKFISDIEKICDDGSMIFQMPILSYLELQNNVFENGLPHTDRFLRPYLHSKKLSWSYPYVNGRNSYAALWNLSIGSLSVRKKVEAIIFAGFDGIYIDTYSLSDDQVKVLINDLRKILNIKPLVSENKDLYFFHLKEYKEKLKVLYGEDDWNEKMRYWLYEYSPLRKSQDVQLGDLRFVGRILRDKNKISLFPDALQYGPYINLEKGIYDIVISGENFNEKCEVSCTADIGKHQIEVSKLEISEREIRYRICLDKDMSNVEFLLKNETDKKILLKAIHYVKKDFKKDYEIQKEGKFMYLLDEKSMKQRKSSELLPGKYILEIFGNNLDNANFTFHFVDQDGKKVNVEGKKLFSTSEAVCIYVNLDFKSSILNFSCVSEEKTPNPIKIRILGK